MPPPVPDTMDFPDDDEIRAAMTPAGGFTALTLLRWGLPWPPPKGWLKALKRRDALFFRRHGIEVHRFPIARVYDDDLFVWS